MDDTPTAGEPKGEPSRKFGEVPKMGNFALVSIVGVILAQAGAVYALLINVIDGRLEPIHISISSTQKALEIHEATSKDFAQSRYLDLRQREQERHDSIVGAIVELKTGQDKLETPLSSALIEIQALKVEVGMLADRQDEIYSNGAPELRGRVGVLENTLSIQLKELRQQVQSIRLLSREEPAFNIRR